MEGDRYVIVSTDTSNAVFEHADENNNVTVDDAPISVQLAPFPNLQVTAVLPPSGAFSSTETVVEWTVTNTGNAPTSVPIWWDGVWLNFWRRPRWNTTW